MVLTETSAVDLLNAGILALTHADAAWLERLAEAVPAVRPIETEEELRMGQERLRTLGALIALTGRNLRLLRGAAGYGVLLD